MVIGVTGNSGSGKSEVSKILAKKINAIIINADEEVKKLSEPGNIYYEKIIKKFGKNILDNKKINKNKLADLIYNNKKARKKINKLTNKYVVKEIIKKTKIEKNKNNNVILDVPLLFESKLNKICNFTVAVIAKEEIKINRIINRDNTNENIAKARLNIQPNDEFYKKRASFIIENNENLEKIDLEEICTKIGKN